MERVKIISIPTEAGTHFPGQARAPDAFLSAKLPQKLAETGRPIDQECLLQKNPQAASAAKWQAGAKISGVRNEENTLTVLESIYNELLEALAEDDDRFLIFLGGDCTILQPILSAMHARMPSRRNDIGLVYMDGDVDLTLPAEAAAGMDHTGILDGMTMTHLTQREGCLPSLQGVPFSSRPDGTRLVGQSDVVLFGFDPLQPSPEHWVYLLENGFKAYPRPTVRKDPVAAADAALEWLESRRNNILLHLDVDVIDCGEFPLANYPHYAGLMAEEAFAALEVFLASPKVKALTITEVNPNNDPDGRMVGRLVEAVVRGIQKRGT
jgi:arginase family enzyme